MGNQEVEKKIMSIVAEDGSIEEVEVILAFEFKDTNKEFCEMLLEKFYKDFKPLLDFANDNMVRMYPIMTDEICPECGKPMQIRKGRYGLFWGCTGYPKCNKIESIKK